MKEEKNILHLYLTKFAAGDLSCLPKLVRRLADRVLFIPILNRGPAENTPGVSIKVFKHTEESREVVPVFTSEHRFETWRGESGASVDKLSVLGADLCIALGGKSWISIDEGSEHEALFNPEVTRTIAETPLPESEPSDTQPIYLSPQQIVEVAAEEQTPIISEESVTATVTKLQDWD